MGELFALGMGLQGLAGATQNPVHATRINTYVDTLDRVISTIRTTIFELQPRQQDISGLQLRLQSIADILAVTREALSNCVRHAGATSVAVSLTVEQDLLVLDISDNGHGIGPSTRSSGQVATCAAAPSEVMGASPSPSPMVAVPD